MQKIPMTKDGCEYLQAELERLKRNDRPNVIKAISEARAHGDLKENAEYHAAKEQQSFIEGRIHDIEAKLSHAHVIDVVSINNDGKVIFGATIELLNIDTDEKLTYQIVGIDEADIKAGKLSIQSPVARAIIGKSVGDEVAVEAPGGVQEYEIVHVEYV